ncbi:SDR family NAD(P)-dependent oxidoreductase [Thermopolyspora sp. NPDC052614]|uniref:SDR family NAD(P)-dependent oxidoreductase n=1 Tax=Thermopolyspora sp. NPDC052614 TaxID=3155682 RepID=UPI00341B95E9
MGRRAVVTAGTGGIGLETAKGLAAAGYAVTVVGRDPGRGARAVEQINAVSAEPETRFVAADLASLGTVRTLAARLAAEGPLTLLVNNVGAMFVDKQHTVDGIEASFALNHLSPYLLTELLLDALKAGAPSRVVNVTSGAAARFVKRTFDAVEPPGGYYGFHWYGRAKLANLAYTMDLAKRLQGTGVSVFAADPGGATTEMNNGSGRVPKIVTPGLRLLWPLVRRTFERRAATPVPVAAQSSIFAALDASLTEQTGLLIDPECRSVEPYNSSTDSRMAEAVRKLSERLAPLVDA